MKAHDLARKLLEGENLDVFLDERQTEFTYGILNTVREGTINLKEQIDGDTLSTDDVIILSED
jgi:hypothetical protein